MILGTHNAVTYARPRHWYGWFMKPFAKCQSKSIYEQYNLGVRCFDLRVRFDKDGKIIMAHGLYEVKSNFKAILDYLQLLSNKNIYVRVILESKLKGNLDLEALRFQILCAKIESEYPQLIFFGGNRKGDWKKIYTFKFEPTIIQAVGSMANQEPRVVDARWWETILPKSYAKRNNKVNTTLLSDEDGIVLFDFVKQWT